MKSKEVLLTRDKLDDYSLKLIERSNMHQEIKDKHIEQVTNINKNSNSDL